MKCPSFLFVAVLAALFGSGIGCAIRLTPYQDMRVGVPPSASARSWTKGVSVTYLGVNGYLLRSGDTCILVDPYFSRIGLREVVMNAPVEPSMATLAKAIKAAAIPDRVDAFLVTHSHFDHLFDVPALQDILGGKVIVSRTGAYLCEASGVSKNALLPSQPGAVHHIGNATVHVLAARHDLVLGKIPYPGEILSPLAAAPSRPNQWRLGTPLAFLIEMGGARIYIESGGVLGFPPPVSQVDLAIVGTAVGNPKRYAEAVRTLEARYVLPSHQDNFFIPLECGFQFATLSNFPRIRATHEVEKLPGELVLMDYFHTWTLPRRTLPRVNAPAAPVKPSSMAAKIQAWFRAWIGPDEKR